MKHLFIGIYTWFLITCSYFCLWIISDYLLSDPILAFLFLPFSFRIGVLIHTPRKYWSIIYIAEFTIFLLLSFSLSNLNYLLLFILSAVSFPIVYWLYPFYKGEQWKKLLSQIFLISLMSMVNAFLVGGVLTYFAFLIGLTGGLLILPACYLLNDFLFNTKWLPLTANLVNKPIVLRTKHIFVYIIIFLVNIFIQIFFPDEFYRFTLFCLAVPIIWLAFQYGWQGAFLGILLNSITLIASIHHFSNIELTDLFLSISAQTVTGIFLGLGIQRQRDLNQSLSIELKRNKDLTFQLINTEESIRKEISRELHDEIGQNITAIRTQAGILKRLEANPNNESIATIIEKLSLNIYDTTKGLLNRIRPRLLDDLDLQQALENLLVELNFKAQGINTTLNLRNDRNIKLENIIEITIYRVCQECLNNIIKYANATQVNIQIDIDEQVEMIIQDNGIGFSVESISSGFGLRGIKERVCILLGTFEIYSDHHGTIIKVWLPRN
ncbi:signal transduction histidine-protein kinase/phosphatase UhpB [Rodentibacter caecimuris]|uniref:Two-component system sensor histidine kinase UhpB n=1 Tax=Rodentibacter caecimuris TaxID=1796644 RepID=A0ABX3KZJ2_9PAST|nr:two-component system sensor histidine kinase UhpB [Rodentibacter heylii]